MPRKDVQKAVADLLRNYIAECRSAGETWKEIGDRFGRSHAWAVQFAGPNPKANQKIDSETERRAAQVLAGGSLDRLREMALSGGLVTAKRYEAERAQAVQLLVEAGVKPDLARRGVDGAVAFKGKARADELAALARSLIAAEKGKQVGVVPADEEE